MKDPLQSLPDHGQSIWLEYIRRDLIASGGLRHLIEEDASCEPTVTQAAATVGGPM